MVHLVFLHHGRNYDFSRSVRSNLFIGTCVERRSRLSRTALCESLSFSLSCKFSNARCHFSRNVSAKVHRARARKHIAAIGTRMIPRVFQPPLRAESRGTNAGNICGAACTRYLSPRAQETRPGPEMKDVTGAARKGDRACVHMFLMKF